MVPTGALGGIGRVVVLKMVVVRAALGPRREVAGPIVVGACGGPVSLTNPVFRFVVLIVFLRLGIPHPPSGVIPPAVLAMTAMVVLRPNTCQGKKSQYQDQSQGRFHENLAFG